MITDPMAPGYYTQVCDCPLTAHKDPNATGWPATEPIPEVLNSDPRPDVPVPAPVAALEALAQSAGWEVRSGYSTGPERAVKVGAYKQTEQWGVWAAPHPETGWRWNAMYSRTKGKTWSWRSTALWLPGKRPRFTHASRTDLSEFILARGEVGLAWFKAVHARVEDQAERARAAARSRPKAKKEGSA